MHSCFSIKYAGKTLVIDPHDGEGIGVGIPAPRVKADYVLVTHEHYDHNAVEIVSREDTVVVREKTGVFTLGPFRVKGVKLPHDEFKGRIRGYVVAYRVEVAGLSITHLSDLGEPLTEEGAKALGKTDVALIPAGNVYTLHPRQALEAAEALEARIAIPMHYWVPGVHLPLEPLENILRYAKKWRVERMNTNALKLTADSLPETRTLIVLSPPSLARRSGGASEYG